MTNKQLKEHLEALIQHWEKVAKELDPNWEGELGIANGHILAYEHILHLLQEK